MKISTVLVLVAIVIFLAVIAEKLNDKLNADIELTELKIQNKKLSIEFLELQITERCPSI